MTERHAQPNTGDTTMTTTTTKTPEVFASLRTYNYVVIRRDGRTITGQGEGQAAVALKIQSFFHDTFYHTVENPIRKIFMSSGSHLMEYTESEIFDANNWN